MNINKLVLIKTLKDYQIPSVELLNDQISKKADLVPKFFLIPYFIYISQPQIISFTQIESYINMLCNQYFKLDFYNQSEREWYKFYTLLRAYREPNKDLDYIYEKFITLPQLESNKLYMKWMQYQVKSMMVSYYALLNIDEYDLVTDIENTAQDVKNFSV